jgi:glycosyltransferase involved in cell wall biosynthesis
MGETQLSVLVALHGGTLSGVDTYAEQVAVAGAAASHHVTLLAFGEQAAAGLAQRRYGPNLTVRTTAAPPRSYVRSLARQVPTLALAEMESRVGKELRRTRERFDVAHLNHPGLADAVRPFADRVVVGAWFYPHSARGRVRETWAHTGGKFPRSAGFALKGLSHYWNDRRGYAASDCIVTPTELLAHQLRSLGLDAVACPPPANLHPGPSAAGARGAREKPRVSIACGNLALPRKNVGVGIEAVHRLGAAGMAVELELIGRNAERFAAQLRRLPASVALRITGPVGREEMPARLQAADVLLIPSLYEEWGYVATEALISGTPVVAGPVYPFVEILSPTLGACATEMSAAALADALAEVLIQGADRSSVANAAAQRFGAEVVSRRLGAIWTGAPASRTPAGAAAGVETAWR